MAADKVMERAWGKPKEEDSRDRPPMSRERILELLRYASTLSFLVLVRRDIDNLSLGRWRNA
jgi:hypothetical protein